MKWRSVVGFEGLYEVSDEGHVRNARRQTKLSPRPNDEGYHRVALSKSVKYYHRLVHRLVCEAFHGPAPEGKTLVLHRDDTPGNNQASNLRWGSFQDNMDDKVERGRVPVRTHCRNGHEFTPETTYTNRQTGFRSCKICRYEHTKASQRRKREEKLNGQG